MHWTVDHAQAATTRVTASQSSPETKNKKKNKNLNRGNRFLNHSSHRKHRRVSVPACCSALGQQVWHEPILRGARETRPAIARCTVSVKTLGSSGQNCRTSVFYGSADTLSSKLIKLCCDSISNLTHKIWEIFLPTARLWGAIDLLLLSPNNGNKIMGFIYFSPFIAA